jgi:hypothetical protein
MVVPLHLYHKFQQDNYCDRYSVCVKVYLMHKINVQIADEYKFETVHYLYFLSNKRKLVSI